MCSRDLHLLILKVINVHQLLGIKNLDPLVTFARAQPSHTPFFFETQWDLRIMRISLRLWCVFARASVYLSKIPTSDEADLVLNDDSRIAPIRSVSTSFPCY